MLTLYRKYRPKIFAEISGQEAVIQILTEELKQGRLAHAYLFSGPRGVGKTSTARIFAKALNCEKLDKSTGEPCGACFSCKNLAAGSSADLIEIDAASNRRIDEIRELRENVKYAPAGSRFKVYIIDEVHMLSHDAFPALLKTLEEPPAHVIFILATTELRKIPDTIFSRCQHFAFHKLPLEKILGRLKHLAEAEKVVVEEEVLQEIARRSGGALRDAESMLGQILGLGKKKITADDASLFLPKAGFVACSIWLAHLLSRDGRQALLYLEKLDGEGVNFEFFIAEAMEMARQLLLYKITEAEDYLRQYFSPAEITTLRAMGETTNAAFLRRALVELLRASNDLRLSPDLPILPLELAVASLCVVDTNTPSPSPSTDAKALVDRSAGRQGEGRPALHSPVRGEGEGGERVEKLPEVKKNDSISNGAGEAPPPAPSTLRRGQGVVPHSLEDILDGWGEVLAKAKSSSHALNFMLGVARPLSVSGDVVELGFKYRLQKEKVSENSNRQIVEKIIEEVYGSRYRVQSVFKEDLEIGATQKSTSPDDEEILIKTALEVFDGAVLES